MDARVRVQLSAVALVVGILLSGPVALAVVSAVHPQPAWQGAARFVAEFHAIQLMPYLGGFVLIGASVALIASLAVLVPPHHKVRAIVALMTAASFAAVILINYIIQSTFVPALVRAHTPEYDALISGLTMANPASLAWALEMWGYAILGVSTWAIACVFRNRPARALYIANGIVSVAGGLATTLVPGWVLTPLGIAAFAVWNVLMIAMGVVTIVVMRR